MMRTANRPATQSSSAMFQPVRQEHPDITRLRTGPGWEEYLSSLAKDSANWLGLVSKGIDIDALVQRRFESTDGPFKLYLATLFKPELTAPIAAALRLHYPLNNSQNFLTIRASYLAEPRFLACLIKAFGEQAGDQICQQPSKNNTCSAR